jgi:hypothetical protein
MQCYGFLQFTSSNKLSVLPVLIPSNRDNTLKPVFCPFDTRGGAFSERDMSLPQRKGMVFTEKRAVSYNSKIYGTLV